MQTTQAPKRAVHVARARLVGDPGDAELVVIVTLEETADLATLRDRIVASALAYARQATGNSYMPIELNLRVTTKRATRVTRPGRATPRVDVRS